MKPIEIEIPEFHDSLEQNEEYFILKGNEDEKIQFHDYERIYQIPGLYEAIFHETLKCQSPTVIKDILFKNIDATETKTEELKILDFGAGNGLVAEALDLGHPEVIVGVDIIDEAREAAMRDRKNIYTDYIVTDLSKAEPMAMKKLESFDLNTLVSVAALGFDHIPPASFINAFNLIEQEGWIAFNIRDKFLTKEDESGFRKALNLIEDDFMEFVDEKTYVHRMSSSGEPIHYTAMVGRKLADIKVTEEEKK